VTVTDALGHATVYAYDEVGNRISQTDANGHVTTFTYDAFRRRTGRTLPGGEAEGFTYDSVGNLVSHTDFNGKVTTYTYDAQGRLLSKTPDGSFHTPAITYTYTPGGLRASMTDATGTSTYAYDSSDRLIQAIKPNGVLGYAYDLANNVISVTTGSGTNVTYAYDSLNRLSSVSDAATGVSNYGYDNVGNLLNLTYPNGLSHAYTYNKKNQLTNLAAARGTTPIAGYSYTLDQTGRRQSVADLGGRVATYTYDKVYRLTSEAVAGASSGPNGSVAYTYDSVGNRLQASATLAGIAAGAFTYDADDRLATDVYDANGNTLSSGGVGDVYDFENRLIQHGSVTIAYDGDGNRVSKTVGGVTTRYLVDENNPTGFAQVIEESGSDGSTRKLVYGLQRISQKQFVASSSASLTSFYVYDAHGSVRALTDASGTVTDTYDYDAFGNLLHETGSTPNEFLFAGEQFDADLGLYYNRARYLKPSAGRFITMDPIDGDSTDPITLHKYLYANADPVSATDPSGNQGDLGSVMTSLAINTTLGQLSTIALGTSLAQSVVGWIAKTVLPGYYMNVIQSPNADAFLAGGSLSYSSGLTSGGFNRKSRPVGATGSIGVDYVIGRGVHNGIHSGAIYYYVGGGVTLGKTDSATGASVYGGVLWNTPTSDDYAGYFETCSVPLGALASDIKFLRKAFLSVAYLVGAAPGFMAAYKGPMYESLQEVEKVFNGVGAGQFSGFFDPTNPEGSVGFSLGLSASNGTSSNLSITLSYFQQIIPPNKLQYFR
jgi:RHS repeat-associated protein